MTLHTRVIVTSPGVDMRATFDKMRSLIGATDRHHWFESPDPNSDNDYRRTMTPGLHMEIGQGLPALMWVEQLDGQPETHDEDCDPDCDGSYHDPAGWLEINFDTTYSYRAANGASCSDLHAWLAQEIGVWLTSQGATWQWYDESGAGWNHDEDWGTLGDPAVGAIGSTIHRTGPEDKKRAFGAAALAAVLASEERA